MLARSMRMLARALLLRCPRCGGRPIFRTWFRMCEQCPQCALPMQRRESGDYWLGGYMFNIVLAELVYVAALVGLIIVTWPRVPWLALQVGGAIMMVLAPVILYPFSRTLWLAFDLLFRPTDDSAQASESGHARRAP